MKSIGRRAKQDRDLMRQEEVQSRDTTHSAARQAEIAEARGRSERGPETQKRPKREREKQPIPRTQPDDVKDCLPAGQNPAPALAGIQPAQGASVAAGRLMQ